MATLKQTIMSREQIAISFDEIEKALRPHGVVSNFVLLDDLSENPSTHDLFKGKPSVCILGTVHSHNHSTKFNHWVSILRKGNEFWFFDSLGNTIEQLTIKLANGKKSLVNWKRNNRVKESTTKLQKVDLHINTCGLYQIVRLIRSDLNNQQFVKWLKHSFFDPDLSVSMLCYLDLLK